METKISLVPTHTLYPQSKKERKTKFIKAAPARPGNPVSTFIPSKAYTKVYKEKVKEKDSSSYVQTGRDSPPKAEETKPKHVFMCEFPRASDYSNIEIMSQNFPHLKDINKPTFQIDRFENMKCFIMRSNNEDDIHKAIKYGIWTSTPRSNEFLDQVYKECSVKGVPIFLLYSVVRSGQFSAVAQLTSAMKPKHFQFWWEDKKWLNHFEVKWIFVKDLPDKCFSRHTMDDNTPVIRARDCTSIPVETAKDMLKIFRDYQATTTILDAFEYMDIREDMMRHYRYSLQKYHNNRISSKKNQKGSTTTTETNSSGSKETSTEADHLTMLLKEFEIMLGFYQREKNRMQQELEEIMRIIDVGHEVPQDELEDLLPEYQDLKCREKEIGEGLEELETKYQAISKEVNENVSEKSSTEKNMGKLQELEKSYRSMRDGFTKDKENMTFFSRKILQLNVNFYQYTF